MHRVGWKAERLTHDEHAWVQTVKAKVDGSRVYWMSKSCRVQLSDPVHDTLVGFLSKTVLPTGCAVHSEPEKKVPQNRQGFWALSLTCRGNGVWSGWLLNLQSVPTQQFLKPNLDRRGPSRGISTWRAEVMSRTQGSMFRKLYLKIRKSAVSKSSNVSSWHDGLCDIPYPVKRPSPTRTHADTLSIGGIVRRCISWPLSQL